MSSVNNHSWALVPFASKTLQQIHTDTLKTRVQSIFADSFKAQLRDHKSFHQYFVGDIVVLVGTSTAGKTSIIKALTRMDGRKEDGVDLRCLDIDLKALNSHNPREVQLLISVFKKPTDVALAILDGDRSWKEGVTEDQKKQAEEAIKVVKDMIDSFTPEQMKNIQKLWANLELEMLDDAFEYARRGGNIIFDAMNIDALVQQALQRNFNGSMRIILTYCPFYLLTSRMEKRNQQALESGELSNQRIGTFPLIQFSELYTQKTDDQKGLERLTREQVTKAFDENFDRKVNVDRKKEGKVPSEVEIRKEKNKQCAKLLHNLGFKENVDEVEIAPKHKSYYIGYIDTSRLLPEESAKWIREGTYHRKSKT